MLSFYIFITALVAPTLAQQFCDIECPRFANQSCADGNVPNPVDCGSFCQCSNCIPYLTNCPPDTHYDPNEDRCRNIGNYNCTVTTLGPEVTTTPLPPGPPRVATYVANRFPRIGEENPVPFDTVFVNVHNRYATNIHTIVVPETAIYFNSISASAFAGIGLEYQLRVNNQTQVDLHRTSTIHTDHDTTSRDYLAVHTTNDALNIASYGPALYSEFNGSQTSWTCFHMSNAMDRDVAWMVARTSDFTQQRQRVTFDSVILNQGGLWDQAQNQLTVARTGVYYLFWTAGAIAGTRLNLDLRRNVGDVSDLYLDLLRTHRNSDGRDVCSRGVLVELQQDDVLYLWSWEPMFSSTTYQVSFGGFEYNPEYGEPVSWSRARSTSWSWRETNSELDPVTFDVVLANQGGAWDPSTSRAICVREGHYYVSINAAAPANEELDIWLMLDDNHIATLCKHDESHNGNYALSRALMVTCQANQRLRLVAENRTAIYSDAELQTSFSGFWLYPL